jgi:hypothetical protein
MPTINVKYYKRWNSSLNSNVGGWEYFAFKTPITAIVEDSSYKLLTASEKSFIDGLLNNNIIDDYSSATEKTYYKGQLVVSSNKVYICTQDVTVATNEAITTSGKFAPFALTEDGVDAKVSALQSTVNSALSGKVNTSDLIENNKIKYSYFPDTITGQLVYGGTVTGTGVATLSSAAKVKLNTTSTSVTLSTSAVTGSTSANANEGIYYIVSSNGSFNSLDLKVGDWLLAVDGAWKKIDNTDAVTMVNGHTGSVYVYQGAFADGTENNNRLAINSFTAVNKGDIWYGSVTERMYINAKDLSSIISSSGVSYLYELINYVNGVGDNSAETESEGLGAIKTIGAALATDTKAGIMKLYTNTGSGNGAEDGTMTQKAIKTEITTLTTNINNHVVYVSTTSNNTTTTTPTLPSTKFTGLICLADE